MSTIKNKKLLITGGTGSFGNAVLKRFLNEEIFSEIRIFSRDEKKQDDLRKKLSSDKVRFYLGDVRNIDSIKIAMKNVDYVFHAAALKQVPSCEFFPLEATKTNVLGTQNVISAANECGVSKLVCLSTDKAAYPINAMGISKALMEKVVVAESRYSQTTICLTRYGNVMASRGSVIPLFYKQISEGKPITITDPNMTRFLMSLDEAVELVWYAFNNGNNGDLFIHKAPSATISDLAEAVKEIHSYKKKNLVIGTRHGEKLYETLCTREEMFKAIDEGNFYRIPADNRNLNYELFHQEGRLFHNNIQDYNSHNTHRLNVNEIKHKILELGNIFEIE